MRQAVAVLSWIAFILLAGVVAVQLDPAGFPGSAPRGSEVPPGTGVEFFYSSPRALARPTSQPWPDEPAVVDTARQMALPDPPRATYSLPPDSPLSADFSSLATPALRAPRSLELPTTLLSIAQVRCDPVRKVVIVVNASSTGDALAAAVADELVAGLDRLGNLQEFAVIASHEGRVLSATDGVFHPAGAALGRSELDRIGQWTRERLRSERHSDMREAIRAAVAMQPDTVFLVSSSLAHSAATPAQRDALLKFLDDLNPLDPKTHRRTVRFAVLHVGAEEPLGTLRTIAGTHGSDGLYRHVERPELIGKEPPLSGESADPIERGLFEALAMGQRGELGGARLALLRIGLGEPKHWASPHALLAAAEISMITEKDATSALTLASAALRSARAFGLGETSARAEQLARQLSNYLQEQAESRAP